MSDRVCSNVCSLGDLPSTPADLPTAIVDLARREISPDTFHDEERGARLASLAACSPAQISLFSDLQATLSERLGMMSTRQIADNLRRLYDRAYRYDPATRTMNVADRRAKRELDLWVAVIDRLAFHDEGFLNRILEVPSEPDACGSDDPQQSVERSEESREIEVILALNSPNLNASDRGTLHRIRNGLMTWEEVGREGSAQTEEWARSYDGRTPVFETSFWKSASEFHTAITAWLGREGSQRANREMYPESRLRLLAAHLGISREFAALNALSNDALVNRIQDLFGITGATLNADLVRRALLEGIIASTILSRRGNDYETQYRESLIRNLMTQNGFTRGDAEILVGRVAPSLTASHLDDYERRNEFSEKFRELYREFLSTPLDERFSPERMARFNLWGQWILNMGRTQGAPIVIEDLDRIRREVQREVGVETTGPITWDRFVSRDVRRPLFVRPDELGGVTLEPGSCDEPLALAQRMTVNGRPLSEIVRENVEFVAILPPELVPADHAAGLAYGLFGVVIMNGGEWRNGPEQNPSPGYFHEVLAHEVAGHEVWAQIQFNDHPDRLAWLGANELYAYNIGLHALEDYQSTGCQQASELQTLTGRYEFVEGIVRAANRKLGLPPDDRTPSLMRLEWSGRRDDFFAFQPGFLVGPQGREVPDPIQEIRDLPARQRRHLTQGLWEGVALNAETDEEEALLRRTVARLDRLAPGGVSETFGSGHPLLGAVNGIRRDAGLPPMEHVTFTREGWEQAQVVLLAFERTSRQRLLARRTQEQSDRESWNRLRGLGGPFWEAQSLSLSAEDRSLLTDALVRLDRLSEFFFGDQPLIFRASHPLVRIYNRYADEYGGSPRRELRMDNLATWRSVEVFLLKAFERETGSSCRTPPADSPS